MSQDSNYIGPSTEEVIQAITSPDHLWAWAELADDKAHPPKAAGIYAWWFDQIPPAVPADRAVLLDGSRLLYVGISPKQPPANGAKPSSQNLRKRIRYHYRGNAEGSTLRLSLGCLLERVLAIQLQVVGSGRRMTFADGEQRLTDWMATHARVSWIAHLEPWVVEPAVIRTHWLPLNLDHNHQHPCHDMLSSLRCQCKARARDRWNDQYPGQPGTAGQLHRRIIRCG